MVVMMSQMSSLSMGLLPNIVQGRNYVSLTPFFYIYLAVEYANPMGTSGHRRQRQLRISRDIAERIRKCITEYE